MYIPLLLCIAVACTGKGSEGASNVKVKAKVPALFTFGDSIVDPGNNDFITTNVKADHPPYGLNFVGNKSTGRCSNGRLSADFLAASLGVKQMVPPYLDPGLNAYDLLTGVSFASAGSGYDNLTARAVNVIPMWKQVELFKGYKKRVERLVGAKTASAIIGEALFVAVAGTNDFVQNYFYLPNRRKQFTVEQYQDYILKSLENIVESIYKVGARKIGVYGLPPTGCLPIQKTLLGQSKLKGCIEKYNRVAVSYNKKLIAVIPKIKARLPGIKLGYVDIYGIILDFVEYPTKYGFETSSRGCCGTGLLEIGMSCNSKTPVTCNDPS
ncbi:hypothetical protein KI387_037207, partial [Taxus chinensis]